MSEDRQNQPQDRSSEDLGCEKLTGEGSYESKTNLSTIDPAFIDAVNHPANISGAEKVHQNLNPNSTIQKMREFHGENSIFEAQPIILPGENHEISSLSCKVYEEEQE
ncbi:MAG TPA: hypothetical protein PKC98_13185, partial [Candidatus Melainabacteria bacterium]|nr:hypothetical protein [Candidatus Melainabacteria bacterium]